LRDRLGREISDQGDVAIDRERVARGCAQDVPCRVCPVDKSVGVIGRGGTVTELPAANVPPPLTVPPALGEALTATVSCVTTVVKLATRATLLLSVNV